MLLWLFVVSVFSYLCVCLCMCDLLYTVLVNCLFNVFAICVGDVIFFEN